MTTAWRVPLCAHVCTPQNAPALARADFYLAVTPRKFEQAELLKAKHNKLKAGAYQEALWQGYYLLKKEAEEFLTRATKMGALLHYGVPAATETAERLCKDQGGTC